MQNYTRIIAGASSNIVVPTVPQINQGNDPLTPYDSAKNNGYYKEMSQAINIASTELTNLISTSGQTPGASLDQVEKGVALYAAQSGVFCIDSGTTNAYVVTQISPFVAPPILSVGMTIKFRPLNSNAGASTVNPFGSGNKNIKQADGSTDPIAGMISAVQDIELRYDGVNFRITHDLTAASRSFIIQDQKASGTTGGTSLNNFNTRVLNTIVKNTISGASLAANAITLPAGTFRVWASAPAYAAGPHQLFLYSAGVSGYVLKGSSQSMAGTGNANQEPSVLFGEFTIASAENFILKHWIRDVGADALGAAVSSGITEVYAQILIEKIG